MNRNVSEKKKKKSDEMGYHILSKLEQRIAWKRVSSAVLGDISNWNVFFINTHTWTVIDGRHINWNRENTQL